MTHELMSGHQKNSDRPLGGNSQQRKSRLPDATSIINEAVGPSPLKDDSVSLAPTIKSRFPYRRRIRSSGPSPRGSTSKNEPTAKPKVEPIRVTREDALAELAAEGAADFVRGLMETSEIDTFDKLLNFLVEAARNRKGVHINEKDRVIEISINVETKIPIKMLLRPKVISILVTMGAVIGLGVMELLERGGQVFTLFH